MEEGQNGMIWLKALRTYMILGMKVIFHITGILFLAAIVIGGQGNRLVAGEAAPASPPGVKTSADETKKDTPPATVNDAVDQAEIDKLIQQLGDKDYYVRQRAQNELARLSFDAFDALTAATTSDDLEIASRAKYLLRLMRVEWTAKNDPAAVKALLKDYERLPEDSRQERMRALADMPDGKGLMALCRLIRFEKSDVVSKIGMTELLKSRLGREPPKGPKAEAIRKLFEKSWRTSGIWMLAWLRLADDPRSISRWSEPIQAEVSLLQRLPGETNREIVVTLIRYQVAWLKKQDQAEEATVAMRRLIDLEDKGDFETLSELLDWLVEEKAWNLVDELAVRYGSRFQNEPMLLYILAQAQNEQGQTEKAEQTAHKAFGLNAGREGTGVLTRYIPLNLMNMYRDAVVGREEMKLLNRYLIAERLIQRGLFTWAKRELEYVVSQGSPTDVTTINVQWSLSEMFHDQGDDLAAANVLDGMLKAVDSKSYVALPARIASVLERFYLFRKKAPDKIIERTIAEVRARRYFLEARHWETTGDQAKRRQCLENAVNFDPTDIDVLIACYRLPEPTPEYRKKVMDLIRQATEDIRVEIAAAPENAEYYNQFAWLIANTEGDLDEALRYSQKSVELSPESGGLYDTLGRVYYARGDYENAVKNQQHAAELEPHAGLIARQLALFKKALEEHKK
jgi:tetratricopeptide (TPR) repeat protein